MSSPPPTPPTPPAPAQGRSRSTPNAAAPGVRRATRDPDDVWLGGVASGLAAHLGLPTLPVRGAFVALAALGGFGVALYAALWLLLPTGERFDEEAPGLGSASRTGRRPARERGLRQLAPIAAVGALGVGGLIFLQVLFGSGALFWPVLLGLIGVAVLWRQADEAQRERWRDTGSRIDPLRAFLGEGGGPAVLRIGSGIGLILLGMIAFALRSGSIPVARDVLVASVLTLVGFALTLGPWVIRLASDLTAERAERVRTQERADMAAHLHDSVLQTLALIQKNADDATTVAKLARSQERDLRSWLFDEPHSGSDETLSGALRSMAADTDDVHSVAVDVVTVGDLPIDETLRPLVAATREAVTNAAKHAGVPRVDVYAEAGADRVEVFVRDRGAGFDPAAVPDDRRGVSGSIVDRMARHGGTGEVRSEPGAGTEVRLTMPLRTAAESPEQDERADPTDSTDSPDPAEPPTPDEPDEKEQP